MTHQPPPEAFYGAGGMGVGKASAEIEWNPKSGLRGSFAVGWLGSVCAVC